MSEGSTAAAAATECAAEQEMFWPYHDLLFEENNFRAYDAESLKRIGRETGLDPASFDECIDSGRMLPLVEQDIAMARQLGIRSTPTFTLNGTAVQGALPFEQFQALIEEELAEN